VASWALKAHPLHLWVISHFLSQSREKVVQTSFSLLSDLFLCYICNTSFTTCQDLGSYSGPYLGFGKLYNPCKKLWITTIGWCSFSFIFIIEKRNKAQKWYKTIYLKAKHSGFVQHLKEFDRVVDEDEVEVKLYGISQSGGKVMESPCNLHF